MRLNTFAWLLWVGGTVLIVASWFGVVSWEIGWTGFIVAGVGAALSWVPRGSGEPPGAEVASPDSPEGHPVEPSGRPVAPDAKLRVGAAVQAYSNGQWWNARVVAVEEGGWVVVSYPGWAPELQERHHCSALQHAPHALVGGAADERIRSDMRGIRSRPEGG